MIKDKLLTATDASEISTSGIYTKISPDTNKLKIFYDNKKRGTDCNTLPTTKILNLFQQLDIVNSVDNNILSNLQNIYIENGKYQIYNKGENYIFTSKNRFNKMSKATNFDDTIKNLTRSALCNIIRYELHY